MEVRARTGRDSRAELTCSRPTHRSQRKSLRRPSSQTRMSEGRPPTSGRPPGLHQRAVWASLRSASAYERSRSQNGPAGALRAIAQCETLGRSGTHGRCPDPRFGVIGGMRCDCARSPGAISAHLRPDGHASAVRPGAETSRHPGGTSWLDATLDVRSDSVWSAWWSRRSSWRRSPAAGPRPASTSGFGCCGRPAQ